MFAYLIIPAAFLCSTRIGIIRCILAILLSSPGKAVGKGRFSCHPPNYLHRYQRTGTSSSLFQLSFLRSCFHCFHVFQRCLWSYMWSAKMPKKWRCARSPGSRGNTIQLQV